MTDKDKPSISYRDAGVDVERGNAFVDRIKPAVEATRRSGVAGSLGGFGGLFALGECGYRDPLLVAATDGVGTKLRLAIAAHKHDSVGIDLVAMCVNDVVVQGAEPLFFLDYFASGSLDTAVAAEVVEGIAHGCRLAGAALLGGETAEMPGMYQTGDYDLAGFCVGAVERARLIDGSGISAGDVLLGLSSSGVHANGFSLVRRIIASNDDATATSIDGQALIDQLLTPTRIYVKPVLDLLEHCAVKGIAHITGGGITDNLPRILPDGCGARIALDSWRLPEIFRWLMRSGPVEQTEMLRTFNCGIGMILAVEAGLEDEIVARLSAAGERVLHIGEVIGGAREVEYSGTLVAQ